MLNRPVRGRLSGCVQAEQSRGKQVCCVEGQQEDQPGWSLLRKERAAGSKEAEGAREGMAVHKPWWELCSACAEQSFGKMPWLLTGE